MVDVTGHRARMRDRAKYISAEEMRTQDLLELLLYYALPRRDTKETAFELLERFKTLSGVFAADKSELMEISGIGGNAANFIKILSDAVNAFAETDLSDLKRADTFLSAKNHLDTLLDDENTCQLCLSAGGHLLSGKEICRTARWGTSSTLRTALNEALITRARGVMLGRRGVSLSEYDCMAVRGYIKTLSACGVILVDFILINGDEAQSMRRAHPEIWK